MPAKKYPIVDYIYPGPQTGSVGSRSFSAARVDHQALAELGFIVVAIDGLGTPWRSKSFHDAFDGDIGDNTLPDQVAALRELGTRYPWIDLDRVGVWGHSGGGYATADAMFTYPDFFKVGISESGNHDNRNYEDDWAEKWQGLQATGKDGRSNYDAQANQNRAANLKGHLLLAHGLMDDNVPPSNTLLVVDALVKANKDFDLVVFPNARHGYGVDAPYMMRRRWDYFVRWLLGARRRRSTRCSRRKIEARLRARGSTPRALAEQQPAFRVAHRLAGIRIDLLCQRVGALRRWTRRDRRVPAPHLRERRQVERRARIRIDPRMAGHVGDAVFVAGDELAAGRCLSSTPSRRSDSRR